MAFAMAFDGTVAGSFLLASLILLSAKLIATVVQLRLMRGNYREVPNTAFFKAVYLAGKATPALAVGCAFVSAMLKHNNFIAGFLDVLRCSARCLRSMLFGFVNKESSLAS